MSGAGWGRFTYLNASVGGRRSGAARLMCVVEVGCGLDDSNNPVLVRFQAPVSIQLLGQARVSRKRGRK